MDGVGTRHPADRDKYTYGYDRNSNRLYRENTVTADLDELYAYDHLNRLTTFHRGDLDQDRTHNLVNEIWNATAADAITEGGGQTAWASPVHSARGNMIMVPKPAALTATYASTYDGVPKGSRWENRSPQ